GRDRAARRGRLQRRGGRRSTRHQRRQRAGAIAPGALACEARTRGVFRTVMPIMTTPPLTCRELVQLITDYLEGGLSRRDRRRFERHLRGCDGCTTYVEQMRETVRVAGALGEEDLS